MHHGSILEFARDWFYDIFNRITPKSGILQFKVFCEDLCFRSAVQWEIAIIGEAMNRILKSCPDIPITSARRIVNTRNYLIHGYDSLKEDLIWAIVINHLPLLKSEVIQLLETS
ncbi:MAG: DUF86 domain-containing protein [Muribaculaceae bacterium]